MGNLPKLKEYIKPVVKRTESAAFYHWPVESVNEFARGLLGL